MQDKKDTEISDGRDPAETRTILFIHGLAWNRQMWLYQQQALEKDFSIITIDLPGHGANTSMPFQFEEAVQTVITRINCLAKRRVILVGLSLGGYVAITCAHRYPENIAGLVISGSCVLYRGWLALLAHLNSLLLSRVYSEKALLKMMQKSLMSTYAKEYAQPIIDAGLHFKASGKAFSELAGENFRTQLSTYPGPILVLNGEYDTRNRKAEKAMLASAQNAQLFVIENAGHLCNMDQPAIFTRAISDFAQAIPWETV